MGINDRIRSAASKALSGLELLRPGPLVTIGASNALAPITTTPDLTVPYPSGFPNGGRSSDGTEWAGRYVRDSDGFYRFVPFSAGMADDVRLMVSSLFALCLGAITDNFPQARARAVSTQPDGKVVPLPDHDLTALLKRPSHAFSSAQTWQRVLTDYYAIGQGYLLIMRDDAGAPAGLFPIPALMLKPVWPADGSEWISYYEYRPFGKYREVYAVDVADLVQFTNGSDQSERSQGRLGVPLSETIAQELGIDSRAGEFANTVLENMGLPGVVITPREGVGPESLSDKTKTDALVDSYQQRVGGGNKGRAIYFNAALRLQQIGFNPEQLSLLEMRHLAEERVASAFGVPPLVAGFGTREASSYNNQITAYRQFWLTCIDPLLREFAEELETKLVPQYPETPGLGIQFDKSEVWALQEDRDAIEKREITKLKEGVIGRDECRSRLGYEPGERFYFLPQNVVVVPSDADVQMVQELQASAGKSALPEDSPFRALQPGQEPVSGGRQTEQPTAEPAATELPN